MAASSLGMRHHLRLCVCHDLISSQGTAPKILLVAVCPCTPHITRVESHPVTTFFSFSPQAVLCFHLHRRILTIVVLDPPQLPVSSPPSIFDTITTLPSPSPRHVVLLHNHPWFKPQLSSCRTRRPVSCSLARYEPIPTTVPCSHTLPLTSPQSQGENRDQGSNSLSGILSTLIPTLIIAVIAVGFFLYFRTRSARVYRPRTDERLVQEEKRTPRSGVGFFSIIRNYNTLPDSYVLKHNSMDGYLWLRYFKVLIVISFAGCLVTWPILFPVNATGGGGQEQLDILSMSNIADPSRYFAHALVAVIFLGFVVLVVCRERLFFVGLRRAFYLSAAHAQRLSSRTLMVMGLPVEYMEEKALRQLFGAKVRKVWIPTDCKSLEKDVKKQTKTALKLEGAEMGMIKKANAARIKAEKKKKAAPPADAEENAGPSQWLDDKKRPRHRLWPRFWKKVDTLNHCRGTLTELDRFVTQQQAEHLDLKHTKVPSAFIEFNSQAAAHEAYQTIGRESKMKFNPRYIGVQPEEVVWGNLGVSYASRKSKIILATIAVWVLIIFWAIPVAFVGILSNINYLTNKVPFLSFINDIPPVILGLVTSLLPVILLAVLMALVPIILRLLARLAGEPTQSAIELKTQSWYFAFQVVQVFLITTFTSSESDH